MLFQMVPLDVLEIIRKPKICIHRYSFATYLRYFKSMKEVLQWQNNNLLFRFRKIVPELLSDYINGYPGETKEDFEILKQWVKDTKFDRLDVLHILTKKTQELMILG